MCGIFGYFNLENSEIFYEIGKYSETRGKEASGFLNITQDSQDIFKFPIPFSNRSVKKKLKKIGSFSNQSTYIGHTRLKTHGDENLNKNNQPIESENLAVVHNGILVNYKELINDFELNAISDLDSEVIVLMINKYLKNDLNLIDALKQAIENFAGEVSVAGSFNKGHKYFLYSNTGSIYYLKKQNKIIFFSSEEWITKLVAKKNKLEGEVIQLKNNNCIVLNQDYEITDSFFQTCNGTERFAPVLKNVMKNYSIDKLQIPNIKRCSQCILPETVPFISFDNKGICNYCYGHIQQTYRNKNELFNILEKEKNIIVGFSGGRDSSFGLSKLKSLLNKNFIAVSFDWGMVTDLARRNQARVVGKLGVEHVWVSANIFKKRNNIKKNFIAWLSRPEIGMLPILMAGDKEWQKQLFKAARNKNTRYVVQFQSPYEHTYFKYGYAGIKPYFSDKYKINTNSKKYFFYTIKLALYYLKNFILNPRYINSSILDTLKGFFSFYFRTGNIVSFYEYFEFVESEVNNHLENYFSWECDPSTTTTWRIGDGTSSIYNYIYWIYGGFTENDFYRSNQIREGKIKREEALKKITYENQPRYDLMREYCKLIDLNYEYMINKLEIFKKSSKVRDWKYER